MRYHQSDDGHRGWMHDGNAHWSFFRVLGRANDHDCSDNYLYRSFYRYSYLNRLSANPATASRLYEDA